MSKKVPFESKGFHPFGDLIGLRFTKLEKGYSQCVLDINKELMNPHKSLHGGVIYSMADTGMGGALYSLLNKNESCATVEIKISYFKPVKEGTLTCDTTVIHKGKTVSTLESKITNNEKLVSLATGTYSIFKINNNKIKRDFP